MSADLLAYEKQIERELYRVDGVLTNRKNPSAWLPPASAAYKQAIAAVAQARCSVDPRAASELICIAESYVEIGKAAERLSKIGGGA